MNLGKLTETLRTYIEILKLRMVAMVLVTTQIGYFLGAQGNLAPAYPVVVYLLLGAGLAAAGALVLNQYLEQHYDAMMERTKSRVLPTGRMSPFAAGLYGTLLTLAGVFLLVWQVNLLTAFLTLLIAFLYVIVYTPLKRVSWINTPIGAIPGAIPPLVGWAAATGTLDWGAWALFLILFVWQHPHFYAIAWLYKEDYRKGGYQMLPVVEKDGKRTMRQILFFSLLLIPVSFLVSTLGITGKTYLYGVTLLGAYLLTKSIFLIRTRSMESARGLLHASLIYLPALFTLILVDS